MIILDKEQIPKMVSMPEAIDAMRSAFTQLSNGEAIVPTRLSLDIHDKNATFLIMPAYAKGCPYYSVKIVSVNYSNPDKGLPLIQAVVQVFDAANVEQLATMDGESITAIRTGAASGLATDLLANKDAKVAAIFGTGVQADSHIKALIEVRGIERVLVFSRNKKSAELFCDLFPNKIKCEIGNIKSLCEADIICTTTPSKLPLFKYENIKPGCHLNVIGSHQPSKREISSDIVENSKIIVDKIDACKIEAGDLIIPMNKGKWSFDLVHGELGQVISGEVSGRDSEDEITLFKSVGNAIQDLALANMIMKKINHDRS